MINLFKPYINKQCIKDLEKVLLSGYVGEGAKVKEFEAILSDYFGAYVVLVNSCTAALHLSLHMIGVRGKRVLTSPMTCLATNTPILQAGGIVEWVDIEENTGNMSPIALEDKITPDVGAVVAVHYGGNKFDFEIA
jgi:dTDP-4-amino-4,6-dideoxygalactose transaminase